MIIGGLKLKLTDKQKESVLTIDGNIVVVASAGSGKTSAFTTRIAHMIKNIGISPYNIMAVTFTKKATGEIKSRLKKMVGKDMAEKIAMGTFHSLAYRLLKTLDPEFSKYKIVPDWWKFSLLNDLCKEKTDRNHNGLNLGIRAGELASFISYQKANMIHPTDELLIDSNVEYVNGVSRSLLRDAYVRFERLKDESRQIDFDDMLLMFYDKLRSDSAFRNKLSDQYKYIMVDEGQDTSLINMEIIKLINPNNVYMVGDFRQSIYKFINARVDNILDFDKKFNNTKVIELNKNFRSTQNIVSLSNRIIENSPIDKYKNYKPSESVHEVGDKVMFTLYESEDIQFEDIAQKIEQINSKGTPLSETAILVRTNSQTAIIEDTLARMDIPYDVSKTKSFFDRKEILDILSYARLAVDIDDDISFRRVINVPNRYLGKHFIEELDRFSSKREMTLFNALQVIPSGQQWKYKRNIESFVKIMDELKSQVEENINAGKLMRNIIRITRYKDYVNETTTNASSIVEKFESIDRLCEMASRFPTIRAFLAHISSIRDKQARSKGNDAVQISTIHSAKGLEWDVVFVPNVNEELLPHSMNGDVEEERRLFYVACSRPKKNLYVSWYAFDGKSKIIREGQFINELIDKDTLNNMRKEIFNGHYKSVYEFPED